MHTLKGGPTVLGRNPTVSFLTATTLMYAIEAGITAAAGTRLCPSIDARKGISILLIPTTRHECLVLLFLVTTSLCQDWVICAPAAFLRSGSRFSGSSPESSPDSLVPVTAMEGQYPTVES